MYQTLEAITQGAFTSNKFEILLISGTILKKQFRVLFFEDILFCSVTAYKIAIVFNY